VLGHLKDYLYELVGETVSKSLSKNVMLRPYNISWRPPDIASPSMLDKHGCSSSLGVKFQV